MSTENKKSRWNRFEIAFNEGKCPERTASQRAWREKLEKTRETGGLEEQGKEAATAQDGEEKPTSERRRFAQEPAPKSTPSEKRSSAVVPGLYEETRPSRVDAPAKKRAKPALKLLKLLKAVRARSEKSPLEGKKFPFPKRPRTFRASAPPRRFDRRDRRDKKDAED